MAKRRGILIAIAGGCVVVVACSTFGASEPSVEPPAPTPDAAGGDVGVASEPPTTRSDASNTSDGDGGLPVAPCSAGYVYCDAFDRPEEKPVKVVAPWNTAAISMALLQVVHDDGRDVLRAAMDPLDAGAVGRAWLAMTPDQPPRELDTVFRLRYALVENMGLINVINLYCSRPRYAVVSLVLHDRGLVGHVADGTPATEYLLVNDPTAWHRYTILIEEKTVTMQVDGVQVTQFTLPTTLAGCAIEVGLTGQGGTAAAEAQYDYFRMR